MDTEQPAYRVVHFDDLPDIPCPCGTARRAFTDLPDYPATLHRTHIDGTASAHYHRRLTELYYILECDSEAAVELDGQRVSVRPGTCVLIPPGVVHRALGRMTILNFVLPKFDPADEFPAD
ncbi:MAG: cupin domain-containing protein [Thermogutta sp.]|nr:cupin domain-containing protein [Thermogutta sp.]